MTEPIHPPRRRFRNARDPEYQGDGWRWSLSLWLPGIPLSWWRLNFEGMRIRNRPRTGRFVVPSPLFHLDLVPLTEAQRKAVYREWYAVQQELGRA
jgi:hypothetical protein